MSEINVQAKKNIEDKFTSEYKKSKIREHNVRAALKNEKKNRPDTLLDKVLGTEKSGETKKSKSLGKALYKEKKTQKFIRKHEDILEERDVSGSGMADLERSKLLKLGVYRDKKGGQVLDLSGSGLRRKSGGLATHGYGKAFLKGGRVK